jgi:hypothetical protein
VFESLEIPRTTPKVAATVAWSGIWKALEARRLGMIGCQAKWSAAGKARSQMDSTIVIDISKTQNPGESVFKAESPADVRDMLIRRTNQFCWQRIKLFQDQIEEAILAAIVYQRIPWITPAMVFALQPVPEPSV